MPVYVTAKTKNNIEIFLKCNDAAICGRNMNKSGLVGEDFSLLSRHSYSLLRNHGADICPFHFTLSLTVPAYEPIKAAVLNVMNAKDEIVSMEIITIESIAGKNKVTERYTAKNGQLEFAKMTQISEAQNNTIGDFNLTFYFDSLVYENNKTNTSGQISTSLG